MMRLPPSNRTRRLAIGGTLIAALALGASAWVWQDGAQRAPESGAQSGTQADREHPIVTTPRIARQDGHTAVRLDSTALQRAGIRTEKVQRAERPDTVGAFATVSDLQSLAQLSASMQSARAQLAIAQAKLAASHAEYDRARRLFEDQQNVSAAQVQSSQAAFAADQAALTAAQAQIDSNRASARLDWGVELADELSAPDADRKTLVDNLLERRESLLEVALPPDVASAQAPTQGQVMLDERRAQSIRLVSPAVRADPRLTGRSYFYRTRPDPALLPGATFAVRLQTGRRVDAASVPASALVWWQGRAWIFVRNEAGDFERREIPVDRAADSTTLLADLADGTEVVVQGAQVLLSEELRAENFSTDVGGR
jgi:hypothetical protein